MKICKLDLFIDGFWNSEIWEILLLQTVFMKCMLCAIYGPIVFGRTLCVSTVKLFPKNNLNFFCVLLMLLFQLLIKGKYLMKTGSHGKISQVSGFQNYLQIKSSRNHWIFLHNFLAGYVYSLFKHPRKYTHCIVISMIGSN